MYSHLKVNKTGLQHVSRPVDRVHCFSVWSGVGVQSPFDAIAVQTVSLLAMQTNKTGGALHRQTPVKKLTLK